jgi:hypothetical protein
MFPVEHFASFAQMFPVEHYDELFEIVLMFPVEHFEQMFPVEHCANLVRNPPNALLIQPYARFRYLHRNPALH